METKGFSMHPFIRDGDRVIVKKLKAQDLKTGDIILYKDNIDNKTVCHRFVKKEKSENNLMLFAKGDAAGLSYEIVREDNFIGKVVGVVRNEKILNLNTRHQIMLNWLTAKFYGFLRSIVIPLKRVIQ